MLLRGMLALLICVILPQTAWAEDRLVRLYAPPNLVETGVLKFALPRFSLKTQVKVQLVETPQEADLRLGDTGTPLFFGLDQTWSVDAPSAGHPGTDKLRAWLTSDVGVRTIQGFAPEGTPLFGAPQAVERVVVEVTLDGDAVWGHEVSLAKCTRCHAVDKNTAWSSIGSTPSFAVLRSLGDWEQRFAAFYALNPHPSFTQIEDLTDPFPVNRPSPISPIELTLEEVEAILAYVAAMPAADLGKPLTHQ
ncbi:MAG: hypothetical protein AAFR93_02730 [Pseudomonadota bacterium]